MAVQISPLTPTMNTAGDLLLYVIPVSAGIQRLQLVFGTATSANSDDNTLDPRLRGDDGYA